MMKYILAIYTWILSLFKKEKEETKSYQPLKLYKFSLKFRHV
jgi:hypothetical protein